MLKHQLKTDRLGINVWPHALAMLDESSHVKSSNNISNSSKGNTNSSFNSHSLKQ